MSMSQSFHIVKQLWLFLSRYRANQYVKPVELTVDVIEGCQLWSAFGWNTVKKTSGTDMSVRGPTDFPSAFFPGKERQYAYSLEDCDLKMVFSTVSITYGAGGDEWDGIAHRLSDNSVKQKKYNTLYEINLLYWWINFLVWIAPSVVHIIEFDTRIRFYLIFLPCIKVLVLFFLCLLLFFCSVRYLPRWAVTHQAFRGVSTNWRLFNRPR